MSVMGYILRIVNSHIEIYDSQNHFIQSADSIEEALHDLKVEYEQ